MNKQQWIGKTLDVSSAWKGLEDYIIPILQQYKIQNNHALEFGVDEGYSSHVLSQVFKHVTGVDTFEGDIHINKTQGNEFYNKLVDRFVNTNVNLVRSDFKDFIKDNETKYDLIHIDIVHTYDATFACADWAVQHSDVVILHDTISFPEIDRVCRDIAAKHGFGYYNIPEHFGLGILHKY